MAAPESKGESRHDGTPGLKPLTLLEGIPPSMLEPDPSSGPASGQGAGLESSRASKSEAVTLFLILVFLAGLLIAGGSVLVYRAEMADMASATSVTPSVTEQAASSLEASGAPSLEKVGDTQAAAGRRTLVRLMLFGLLLFGLTSVGAWFLADARVKWRMEHRRAQALGSFDTVTGLPNRSLFFDRLEQFHLHSARYRRSYGLILLDLDGFGTVNDRYGYSDGDQLLIRVGRMLTNSLRNSDTIARVGGDEFAVLLSEVSDVNAAMMLGRKVAAAVAAPIRLPGGEAEITASVGVAVFPKHGSTLEDMLRAADEAMDRAKREGRGCCLLALSPDEYPRMEDLAAGLLADDRAI